VGHTVTDFEVRKILGLSQLALEAEVHRRRVLGLLTSDRHLVLPRWQFIDGHVVDGLAEILVLMHHVMSDWTLASWLRTPGGDLHGRSPAELLLSGDSADRDLAIAAARRVSDRWKR
jgi:hypothetical protein